MVKSCFASFTSEDTYEISQKESWKFKQEKNYFDSP